MNIFYFISRTLVAFKNLFKKRLKNNYHFTLLSMCSLESYFKIKFRSLFHLHVIKNIQIIWCREYELNAFMGVDVLQECRRSFGQGEEIIW